jgi:5'(3')-deoxyribonucleotidase
MNTKPLFCLDMDGVVADFISGAAAIVNRRLYNSQQHYTKPEWQQIIKNPHIYRNLPLMPLANQFVNLARQFRDVLDYELVFLTAIPHDNDMPWAFWDKIAWAQQHWPDIPVHFGPYSHDKKYRSAPNNILVDDRADSCKSWQERGGIAVLVPVGNEIIGLNHLEQIYNQKISLKNIKEKNWQ